MSFNLRLTNFCSSWEKMLLRWAPCMRHSLSAASQFLLWGKYLKQWPWNLCQPWSQIAVSNGIERKSEWGIRDKQIWKYNHINIDDTILLHPCIYWPHYLIHGIIYSTAYRVLLITEYTDPLGLLLSLTTVSNQDKKGKTWCLIPTTHNNITRRTWRQNHK